MNNIQITKKISVLFLITSALFTSSNAMELISQGTILNKVQSPIYISETGTRLHKERIKQPAKNNVFRTPNKKFIYTVQKMPGKGFYFCSASDTSWANLKTTLITENLNSTIVVSSNAKYLIVSSPNTKNPTHTDYEIYKILPSAWPQPSLPECPYARDPQRQPIVFYFN